MTDFVIEAIEETDTSEVTCEMFELENGLGARVIDANGIVVAQMHCGVTFESEDHLGFFVDGLYLNTNNESSPTELMSMLCEEFEGVNEVVSFCFGCIDDYTPAALFKEFCNGEMWFEDSNMVFFTHFVTSE